MMISVLSMFFSSFAFMVYQTHCLNLLICLEAMMLSLLVFSFSVLMNFSETYWFLVLLAFAASEAAIGLSILVSLMRIRGSDLMSIMSSNMY
uniref:NADH-ubiquinone oxidoreductase chain 4L n=1 Tax=Odontoglaja guamensis TaxID=259595 RepID=E6Y1B1_9GAST|nr:NADH dehydrogenase subunit 4L [Odontoglaja guamensis]